MFDKLAQLEKRYDELSLRISDPEVIANQAEWKKDIMAHSELEDIVEGYRTYKKLKEEYDGDMELLAEEDDPEMKALAEEEAQALKEQLHEWEEKLKVLLLPKDPNDDKDVVVEIRAGAGGDEAALFAAEIYRMYVKYAESRRWKTELMSLNENGIGGFKEVTFMINGAGAYSRLKYESGVHRVQHEK